MPPVINRRLGGAGVRRGLRAPGQVSGVSLPTADLLAWYEPRDASNTVSTGRFDTFADLSGNGNDLSAVSAGTGRPVEITDADYNNQVVAEWDATAVAMRRTTLTQGVIATPQTHVLYGEIGALNQTFWDGGGSTNRVYCYCPGGTLTLRFNAGAGIDAANIATAATPVQIIAVYDGLSSAIYNGDPVTPFATGGTGGGSQAGLTLGALYTNGFPLRGKIAFHAVYGAALVEAARQQVTDYLTQEFG